MTSHVCPNCHELYDYASCWSEDELEDSRPQIIVVAHLPWWRRGLTKKEAARIRAAVNAKDYRWHKD